MFCWEKRSFAKHNSVQQSSHHRSLTKVKIDVLSDLLCTFEDTMRFFESLLIFRRCTTRLDYSSSFSNIMIFCNFRYREKGSLIWPFGSDWLRSLTYQKTCSKSRCKSMKTYRKPMKSNEINENQRKSMKINIIFRKFSIM